jgi:hypothetical protein
MARVTSSRGGKVAGGASGRDGRRRRARGVLWRSGRAHELSLKGK